ncbi:outer membrane protein assembly factor BamA [Sphingomonas sp. ID0503]|uniref:outer membrane protein assembly factor BamA n=1 Tax=Sphingomonas sp. ID0503 TaxID=3399691 RepID=UPI003AFB1166
MLGGIALPVSAQDAPAASSSLAPPAAGGIVSQIQVVGAERLEPDTVRSYLKLRPGQPYTSADLDQALKDLYATELFTDVQIRDNAGTLVITVRENPVVNRIVLEGNKRLKEDKIRPEIKLAPRQIFSRSKVRADVARIVELYRRQGRFAATVEPKMVTLDQNRVDVVFEISEGAKSKVRQINIIGNEKFSDGQLRSQMATKQARFFRIFSSGDSYDPDRLAYDQQKLRQFYLTEGYADFRVASAVAELTPDKRDFIITYVVEEGPRYKFGDIDVQSDIRDLKAETLKPLVPVKKGDWYNAKTIEDTVDRMTETAGLVGYAFAEVNPDFRRDKDALTMSVTFKVADAPRVYVERVDINGNTNTRDKVVRREFRLAEGDAFNSVRVKRSTDRIKSLGYFQENFEIEQKPGSAPDRVILEANVEEKSTGELQVSAGYSSLEKFIVDLNVTQRNFMGKGQELRTGVSWSKYSKSVNAGFTEPYLFDKNIALGFDVFRREYNSFNYRGNGDRNTTYEQTTTGFQIRTGIPLTEFWSLALRYGLSFDDVSLDKDQFYSDRVTPGVPECDPILAGRYLCDAIGKRTTSSLGYSLVYSTLNNGIRPTRGHRFVFSQDFAGVGGNVKYLRTRAEASKYFNLGSGFIFSTSAEGGYIKGLGQQVRLVDRFQLGQPELRGFDIRGVGPRVLRVPYNTAIKGFVAENDDSVRDDALGGNAYYQGRLELEIPIGAGGREMGLRPSLFMDMGAVFNVRKPELVNEDGAQTADFDLGPLLDTEGRQLYLAGGTTYTICPKGLPDSNGVCQGTTSNAIQRRTFPAFQERFYGDTWKPRLSIGFGVNWRSPFGPFRIDIAKALLKYKGDDTKLFSFNVGTQF